MVLQLLLKTKTKISKLKKSGSHLISVELSRNKVNASVLRLRHSFERFKKEFKDDNIECEMRIIADNSLASEIHDRWILSKNASFNIPSPDIVARGQCSEVKKTNNTLPFEDMWKNSLDIITDWNEIEKLIQNRNIKKI